MGKFIVSATAALALAGMTFAEPITSGPQAGEKVPGPFKPLHVNGPDAGERECLYCKFGACPVVMIFAREPGAAVEALVKKIDAATAAHRDERLGSCAIFLSDSKELPAALKSFVAKEGISGTILALDSAAGPASYKIASEADITVILYSHRTVKANRAFRKGELTSEAADAILGELPKILADH
jgi:hypothetical protein